MMLFKLSLKNIQKSIKDYLIYFFTLVLGVSVFYVFNAIESQTILITINENNHVLIDLMNRTISGISILVSFILGFLILYANQFLIKRRSKEFALYMLLGMSKRKISIILFFETLCIGIISLFCGIIIGVFLSQLMSILIVSFFNSKLDQFIFIFSMKSCIKTISYFVLMYIIIMIFNTININTKKLIELLNENRKNNTLRIHNPYICIFIFILSCIVLGYAYYLVTGGIGFIAGNMARILIPIGMGIVSTFLIFYSLSGFLLWLSRHMKSFYYKDLHSFILRQFNSKINTTVISTSIICLLLLILSSGFTVRNSVASDMETLSPVDFQYMQQMHVQSDDFGDLPNHTPIENLKTFHLYEKIDDYVETNEYMPEFTFIDFMQDSYFESPYNGVSRETFVKLSDYNKLATFYHKDTYTLEKDEYMILCDFQSIADIRNIALQKGNVIHVYDHDLKPKYDTCKEGFIQMTGSRLNSGVFVVNDEIIDESTLTTSFVSANFKEQYKDMNLTSLDGNNYYGFISYTTKNEIYDSFLCLAAMIAFIGMYLGIIFLLCSTALLSLKELSQISDDAKQYELLMKMGCPEKDIKKALFQSIGIYFLFPLLLALIHSFFGMKFALFILEMVGVSQLIPSLIMTFIFLAIIYGSYFLITYLSSKNIVLKRQRF